MPLEFADRELESIRRTYRLDEIHRFDDCVYALSPVLNLVYQRIVQCIHCRRTKRPTAGSNWDWIPEWINSFPENTSHGLCEPCYGYFYPQGSPPPVGRTTFVQTGG